MKMDFYRCDGRLKYAEFLPYDVKYPVILPRNNSVTTLIVKHYHDKGKHVTGTNHTLSMISARFWTISAREEIRKWERMCSAMNVVGTRLNLPNR
jgi:hypothetical protein